MAITRQKPGSPDGEILYKDETLNLEAILKAYTIEGAIVFLGKMKLVVEKKEN